MRIFDHCGAEIADFFRAPLNKSRVFSKEMSKVCNMPFRYCANNEEEIYYSLSGVSRAVNDPGFYFFEDAILRGSGFVIKNGIIIDAADLIPSYIRDQIGRQDRWDLIGLRESPIEISSPVVAIAGDCHKIYGHWIIDILPRAWLYTQKFGTFLPGAKIALPIDTPKYATEILDRFFGIGSDQIVHYDVTARDIKAAQLIVPSLLHADHYFHSAMNFFVQYVAEKARKIPGGQAGSHKDKIFVSRMKFRDKSISYKRTIKNEPEVHDLMCSLGFTIVYPEELSWEEQITLFSNASVVVGEAGSGLHNTMFSPFGCSVICINPVNQVQGTIAGLRRQNLIYLKADSIDFESEFIDVAKLSAACRCLTSG